ncbi:TPA: hypothetical protein DF272_01840 [Candidatus Falkowbacteria bacterium]|nr:hypothetical protein [Candidatus Falkowbacteria bacterium]
MKSITSVSNLTIKEVKKLHQKKYREKTGLFLVENLKIIMDAFTSGFVPCQLFFTSELVKKNSELQSLINRVGEGFEINDQVNKSISTLDTPSGIVAVYDQPEVRFSRGKNCLYLNAINDPGNLGTLLRSAVAFGFDNIILDEACVDLYNPKTIHAAKDAIFKLNFSFAVDFSTLKTDYYILTTSVRGSNPEFKIPKTKSVCLILGSESHGVDPSLLKLSDQSVSIPTTEKIESLNVAVAGSILMEKIFNKK